LIQIGQLQLEDIQFTLQFIALPVAAVAAACGALIYWPVLGTSLTHRSHLFLARHRAPSFILSVHVTTVALPKYTGMVLSNQEERGGIDMSRLVWALLIFLAAVSLSVSAAPFPAKPITYIICFDPGGQSDLEARRQQPLLEELLGTPVIVQYKVGGGGSLGWAELASSPPDGHTIAGINIPHIILQPLLRGDAGYSTDSIIPVALFQATPIGLAVPKDSPWQTLDDFIAYAKANPGAITVGGSGTYSGHHLAHLQLEKLTNTQLSYVPFTGAAPQVAAFLGGHIAAMLANSNDLVLHRDKLRVLAFGARERFSLLPDAPTFLELGLDMIPSIDRGVGVPKGTPPEQVAILERAFLAIMERPEIQEAMISQGFVPLRMSREECEDYIQQMTVEYGAILQELNITGAQ
jgi:tripartite-type tricarboxylate transporter receptor subunit TctC